MADTIKSTGIYGINAGTKIAPPPLTIQSDKKKKYKGGADLSKPIK